MRIPWCPKNAPRASQERLRALKALQESRTSVPRGLGRGPRALQEAFQDAVKSFWRTQRAPKGSPNRPKCLSRAPHTFNPLPHTIFYHTKQKFVEFQRNVKLANLAKTLIFIRFLHVFSGFYDKPKTKEVLQTYPSLPLQNVQKSFTKGSKINKNPSRHAQNHQKKIGTVQNRHPRWKIGFQELQNELRGGVEGLRSA